MNSGGKFAVFHYVDKPKIKAKNINSESKRSSAKENHKTEFRNYFNLMQTLRNGLRKPINSHAQDVSAIRVQAKRTTKRQDVTTKGIRY